MYEEYSTSTDDSDYLTDDSVLCEECAESESDYYEFDINDHSWEIGTIVDERLEEQEEDDGKFRERVTDVLKDITVGFDVK